MLSILFDENWVPRQQNVQGSWVRVTQNGEFKKGYEKLLFETNDQIMTNIWFQKEKNCQPLWINERFFYCCVVQKQEVCTICGKNGKNRRALKRHRKLYHFKN
jgi:hypothetical protein